MSKRQATPNVLSDLLDSKTAKQPDSKTASQESDKVKVTNYLTEETVEGLDLAHLQMRQYTRGRGRRLTKSEVVEAMLKMGLADFAERGEGSRVFDFL